MLPELDDLERRGLFSRKEIAEIVKRRRKFEYRLKRPSPLKHDFLAYIDYEKQLDSLCRLRKKSFMKRSGGKKSKNSISDYAGVSRIIDIYRLATNRFKGDVELWFQYLEFCRARGHGRMKKVLDIVVKFIIVVFVVVDFDSVIEFEFRTNVWLAVDNDTISEWIVDELIICIASHFVSGIIDYHPISEYGLWMNV